MYDGSQGQGVDVALLVGTTEVIIVPIVTACIGGMVAVVVALIQTRGNGKDGRIIIITHDPSETEDVLRQLSQAEEKTSRVRKPRIRRPRKTPGQAS